MAVELSAAELDEALSRVLPQHLKGMAQEIINEVVAILTPKLPSQIDPQAIAQQAAEIAGTRIAEAAERHRQQLQEAVGGQGGNGHAPAAQTTQAGPSIGKQIFGAWFADPKQITGVVLDVLKAWKDLKSDDLTALDAIFQRRPHLFGLYTPAPLGDQTLRSLTDALGLGMRAKAQASQIGMNWPTTPRGSPINPGGLIKEAVAHSRGKVKVKW